MSNTVALLALVAAPAIAQQQEEGDVAGMVVAQASQGPLADVQVSIADQPGKKATTDVSGRFRLTGVSGTEVTLTARLIGYRPATRTVPVGATDVRLALADRPIELDQIVVTGTAGGQQQRALGNSVATIKADAVVAAAPIPDVQSLINGRAAGVVVMPGTGMVGSGAKIRVRGVSTFSLSGEPLIYVDGVRVNNETGTGMSVQAFGSGVVSRLNDFDPAEIESVEILKGPAAATLYGTEAARGVINIITKKGATSGTRYSFTVRQGGNWFMDPEGRVPTNYWRDTLGVIRSVNVIQTENARGTPVFRTGTLNDYAASLSGGAGILRYFASAGCTRDQGAEPNNARRQTNVRSNLQVTPSPKVDLETSVGYISSNTTLSCEAGCGGATWGSWFSTPKNLPQYCGEVPGADPVTCGWARGFQSSPPEADRSMQDWQDINRFTGSVTLNYHPLKWMTHRVVVGTDFTQEKNQELLPYLTNDTVGFYAQQQFGWQNRLFLTAALRVDNNSSFGKDIKWVTYPKASLSWVLNEEPFFQQHAPALISTLKVRGAYGESGVQPDIFTALRTLNPVPGPNGTPALTPGAIGNPNLGPERGKEIELGFDAGLWSDRVGVNFTYYNTRTLDAILLRGVAPSSGFGGTNQYVNAGEIRNSGIETLVKAQLVGGRSYGWDVSLSLSHNSGKVVKLKGTDTTIVLGDIQQRIGYAPWSWFRERVVSADFDAVTKRAINVMCDDGRGGATPCFNANGLIVAPRVYLGRAVPSLEGSFASNVRFLDRFRLTMMIDFKSGYKKLDNNLRARCQVFRTCLENMEPQKYDPRLIAQMQSNGTLRDFVINDAKFAKLREIALSYDAPESYAARVGARSISFSVAARNLHTWTGYTGVDPEDMFLSGTPNFLEQSNLPQLASFVFTTHVSF